MLKNIAVVGIVAFSTSAAAQYATQSGTGEVWKNPYGLCWHSAFWTPDQAIEGCDAVARPAPAPRAATLEGLRLGILDNTKWNANRLLRKTADRLGEQHRFAVVHYYKKESFSKNADPALLAQIVAENDIVLTAIGD